MALLSEFAEAYERLAGSRHTYKSLEHIKTGIPRWRLQVFEKDTATTGGDMLLLCIERPTKEECLIEGIERIKNLIRDP